MFRQNLPYQPYQSRQQTTGRQYLGTVINKPYIPIKEINEDKKKSFFMTILDGDINKIQLAISELNMGLNILNEENKSPIHIVLENNSSGLREMQKYEIIQLLIDNGASVSAYDVNNITPLHLASKYQYPKIVELLIKYGADTNVIDSNSMCPLHYATQGFTESCKPKKRPVGALIPSNVKTEKGKLTSLEFQELVKQTMEILESKHFKLYLTHIGKIFEKVGDIYPFDLENEKKSFIREINEKIAEPYITNMEKKTFIEMKIGNLIRSINLIAENKLSKTLRPLDIGTHNVDGWAPLNTNSKILPREGIEYTQDNIRNNFNRNAEKIFNQLTIELNNFNIKSNKLSDIDEKIYMYIHHVRQVNANAKINKIIGSEGVVKISPVDGGFEVDDDVLQQLFVINDNYPFYQEININQRSQINDLEDRDRQNELVKIFRGPKTQRNLLGKYATTYVLTDDRQNTEGVNKGDFVDEKLLNTGELLGNRIKNNRISPFNTFPENSDTRFKNANNDSYYYISNIILAIRQIKKHIANITENVNQMKKQFIEYEYLYELYQTIIPNIYLSLFNIFQNISLVEYEKNRAVAKTNEINKLFVDNYNKNREHPYSYLLEYASECLENINKLINDTQNESKYIFDICLRITEKLNSVIGLANIKAGVNYIENFFNDFTNAQFDTPYDIFDRELAELKYPPKNINQYSKYFTIIRRNNDYDRNKKTFYTTYSPFIDVSDNLHFANYIINTKYDVHNGQNFRYTPSYGNALIAPLQIVNANSDIQNGYMEINSNLNINYTDERFDTRGTFGVKQLSDTQIKGSDFIFGSIGTSLDEYLYNAKYWLVQKLIEVLNKTDFIDNTTMLVGDIDMQNRIDTNNTKYKMYLQKLGFIGDVDTALFINAGKIADELIIVHIKKVMYKNINDYIKKFIDSTYTEIPLTLDTLFKIDTGFSLKLQELYREFDEQIIDDQKTDDQNFYMHTVNVMENEREMQYPEQFQIYNTNYHSLSEMIEKQCYNINIDVLKQLIRKTNNLNAKDRNGSSPIFYSIKNLHYDSVKELIDSKKVNVFVDLVKNKRGLTPYHYALAGYNHHINTVANNGSTVRQIINYFCDPVYKQIRDTIEGVPEYKNNVVKYLDIIFPQLLIMFNNLLAFYAKSYNGKWTYDKQQEFEILLSDNNIIYDNTLTLPLLEKLGEDIIYNSITKLTLKNRLDNTNKQNDNTNKKISQIMHAIQQLKNEAKNETGIRKKQIEYKLSKLNSIKNTLERNNIINANKLESIKNGLDTNKNIIIGKINSRTNRLTKNPSYLARKSITGNYNNAFKTVSDVYKDIFNIAINQNKQHENGYEDHFLYNAVWKLNVNDERRLNNISNINLVVVLLEKKILKVLETNNRNAIANAEINLQTIRDLYKNVFTNNIENYFDLKQEYNVEENYILYEVMEIITHIVKHVICSNFYYAIINVCTKYVSTTKNNMTVDELHETVNRMINPNYNDNKAMPENTLYNYILNVMPTKIVKLKLNIYDGDFDEDRNFKAIDECFINIKNILTEYVKSDSSLIVNLDTYVFGYYKNLFDLTIPLMKVSLDNYCRFIINNNRHIQIMHELLLKTMNEF